MSWAQETAGNLLELVDTDGGPFLGGENGHDDLIGGYESSERPDV